MDRQRKWPRYLRLRSTRNEPSGAMIPAALALLLLTAAATVAWSQNADGRLPPAAGVAAPTASAATTAGAASDVEEIPPAARIYGAWALLPAGVAIVLAIAFRQVVPALTVGVLVGSYMIVGTLPPEALPAGDPTLFGTTLRVVSGLRLAVETYLVGAMTAVDHVKILLFTLTIGGMVGIIAANGGTGAVVARFAHLASTRRRGQLAAWFAGILVFFDDYANAMIVGPTMRPIFDRLRISRAKLAYIVDSTAAPVASIAIVGTWVGAEIGFIAEGLDYLKAHDRLPEFLGGVQAANIFYESIPYRFYAILALVMVLLVALLNRDFGPMKRAEREAPEPPMEQPGANSLAGASQGRAWYAVVPVLLLVLTTLGLLGTTGYAGVVADAAERQEALPTGRDLVSAVASRGDPLNSILYGAIVAIIAALAISLFTRALKIGETVDAATNAMSRMFPTIVVLVLAWTLSGTMNDLHVAAVAKILLTRSGFDVVWLPMLVFLSSAVVSFATGTSWGTMGILCPLTVTLAGQMLGEELAAEQIDAAAALPLFYAAVGSVLAGSIFGDHCSPISDTTVLSSLATECTLEEHVWTQLPYALVVAVVSALSGELLCRYYGSHPVTALLAGSVLLLLIVLIFGSKPRQAVVP